jgi:hypothetical protein
LPKSLQPFSMEFMMPTIMKMMKMTSKTIL